MSYTFEFPVQYFPDPTIFGALGLGSLYVGVPNGNPATVPGDRIQVYAARQGLSDLAISQPISISAGGVPLYNGSPVTLKVLAPYSVQALDYLGVMVYNSPHGGDEISEFIAIDARIDAIDILISSKIGTVANFAAIASTPLAVGQLIQTACHTSGVRGALTYKGVSSSGLAANGGTISVSGTAGVYAQAVNYEMVTCDMFGTLGDDTANDTAALQLAINSLLVISIPPGIYRYTTLTGLDRAGLVLRGAGSETTVLKCTAPGVAATFGTSAFREGINVSGLTFEGNAATTDILLLKALARSKWNDINAREANNATGRGIVIQGCSLNQFDNFTCSEDRQAMTNAPAEAINIESLSPFGNSSNNVFINLYAEGLGVTDPLTIDIGVRISGGDQNVFLGGSPESCKTWGLLIAATCRYNTFIGVGFENLNAAGGDFSDGGLYTKFINCYSSQKAVLQGRSAEINGGIYERIQIDSGAFKNEVKNVSVNNWATGSGGYFDSGTGTTWKALYDVDLAAFIYPTKDRVGLSLPLTGVPYTNTTGDCTKIITEGGVVTGATVTRGANTWNEPFTSGTNVFLLAPNDILTLSYSSTPTKFWQIPMNGFES